MVFGVTFRKEPVPDGSGDVYVYVDIDWKSFAFWTFILGLNIYLGICLYQVFTFKPV